MTRVISKRAPRETLPHGARKWLLFGTRTRWLYLDNKEPPETVWERHAEQIVAHCVQRNPGFRPILWWRHSAPGLRQRLGGVGQPLHEVSNTAPAFEFGVPKYWCSRLDQRGVPLSESDPPQYESEASFLKRHGGLWLPGEEARLTARSFEPWVIVRSAGKIRLQRQSSPRPRRASSLDELLHARA